MINKPDIPNFELERCCGSGAFGDVWVGRDLNGVRRAVKVLNKERLKNLGVLDKEIRGLKLYCKDVPRHPNLIEVFHTGETEALLYYAMELADNATEGDTEYVASTLALKLNSGVKITPAEASDIAWSVLDAVSALHQAGLVHRDIKPDNIVYVNGKTKLADMGLLTPNSEKITLAGTQGFLPPEGVNGYGADLYAVGKLLYCMLTGNPATDFPSLPDGKIENTLGVRINRIILKACSQKESERFQSAAEFQMALTGRHPLCSEFNPFSSRNIMGLLAIILSIIALSAIIVDKWTTSHVSLPPSSIMEQDNIHLPELDIRLIRILPNTPELSNNKEGNLNDRISPFWIGRCEITQGQYKRIMGTTPSRLTGEEFPVDNISFADAVEFCERLTESERAKKRLPKGYEYRLPTNMEWEFAANEGSIDKIFKYSGSDLPDYYAWFKDNANNKPHPVARKKPNKLKLYDLSGNVWEYCIRRRKVSGKKFGSVGKDVLIRGGSWKSTRDELDLECRYYCSPTEKMNDVGFRIVLSSQLSPRIK